MTPQQCDSHAIDNGITHADSCYLIEATPDTGAGKVHSYAYPEVTEVYSFECYGGNAIGQCWHPSTEANFGLIMAFAAAIKWDAEMTID